MNKAREGAGEDRVRAESSSLLLLRCLCDVPDTRRRLLAVVAYLISAARGASRKARGRRIVQGVICRKAVMRDMSSGAFDAILR